MSISTGFTVAGGTPGADSNTYVLFSSVSAWGAKGLPMTGIQRLVFSLKNSHSGTLNAYMSVDGGTNWDQLDTQAVAAPAAGAISGPYDYLVDPYLDFKLEWVNGGSAQTTWRPVLVGVQDRSVGT